MAISNAYYSDNRTASDAVSKLGTQLRVDKGTNILKEFWLEFERKFSRKHRRDAIATDQLIPLLCGTEAQCIRKMI